MSKSISKDTDVALGQIRVAFNEALPAGRWTANPKDVEEWLEVLRASLDPYLSNGGKWGALEGRIVGLTKSIATLSMSLSLPEADGTLQITRRALILAAVIVSNSCHTEPGGPGPSGRPCSNVVLGSFDRTDEVLAFYKQRYKGSGLT
ncbi:MAG: hypothetical protein JJE39_07600 [Vicinamibacteria bacterium]|nr:hypothetical protein [Vicinamibacteria bacterium]